MMFFDTAEVSLADARMTSDGFMVVDARSARTGIQVYTGAELGKPHLSTVRLHRPESEVFADEAMATFAHKTVTNDHPKVFVNAKNWTKYSRGQTGDTVARDGDALRVPFTLMDAGLIDAVRQGKRELSWGYNCNLDWTPGKTEAGEAYDAVQTNIRANHLAVVTAGRAGSEYCRIGDALLSETEDQEGNPAMPGDNMRTVLVDGFTVTVNDQGAQAIERLQKMLNDATASTAAAVEAQRRAIETKDGELAGLRETHRAALAAKDGEIAGLKAAIPDAAAMDAALAEKEAVITAARTVLPASTDLRGKSIADIRRVTVAARLGDAAITGKGDEFVMGCFDAITASGGRRTTVDPVRNVIRAGTMTVGDAAVEAATKARSERLAWLQDSYKSKRVEA